MKDQIERIIENTRRCNDEPLARIVSNFLDSMYKDMSKSRSRFGLNRFREAFQDTDVDGTALFNLISGITEIYRALGLNGVKNGLELVKSDVTKVLIKYVENPGDETLKIAGDFVYGLRDIVHGNFNAVRRRPVESYKTPMFTG